MISFKYTIKKIGLLTIPFHDTKSYFFFCYALLAMSNADEINLNVYSQVNDILKKLNRSYGTLLPDVQYLKFVIRCHNLSRMHIGEHSDTF